MPTLTVDEICSLVTTTFGLPSADLLDSFHLVELIAVLEKSSGRKIGAGDVNLENLDTPRRIAVFLASDR